MNILVIGDVILDINYISEINRKAPEANIPIHDITNINYILGGASNVAQNLHYLNTHIELISVIGNDEMGKKIDLLLNEKGMKHHLFIDETRKTTQKHRIFHNKTLQTRYDIEDKNDISNIIETNILEYIYQKEQNQEKIDAIIISDYDKGVVTHNLCKNVIEYSNKNNIYTFVDPKIKNINKYKNCFCFKPNLNECEIITKEKEIDQMFMKIKEFIQPKNIILTCGEKGMYINEMNNHICHENIIDVIDVTGAGDIVLCLLVYIFLQKKDMILACKIANYVAGKSVQTIGNYNVSIDDIDEYYNQNNQNKTSKIIYDYEIDKIQEIKNTTTKNNKKIVFTNGCFDIIHSAHIKNLQFSKNQGDILVVGLNSDESIKKLKGKDRPINSLEERTELLSLFDFIDYIIVFHEDTPLDIIKFLKPNILVKGSDYKKENIIGLEYVENVILFDYIKGKSSTLVINKILHI
jgi:D-beta-D-heptose 7-phosphate kinase/D-beta-D-heptose 1-phosphate adenosyltransferase